MIGLHDEYMENVHKILLNIYTDAFKSYVAWSDETTKYIDIQAKL